MVDRRPIGRRERPVPELTRGTDPATVRSMVTRAPYGSWPSPISPDMLVAGASLPTAVAAAGGDTWWSESRPAEGGRTQLVRRDADGTTHDLLPADHNARTRVHEYGGGAWWVHGRTTYFTNWADQRLYRLTDGSTVPVAVTPEPRTARLAVCRRDGHPGRPAHHLRAGNTRRRCAERHRGDTCCRGRRDCSGHRSGFRRRAATEP